METIRLVLWKFFVPIALAQSDTGSTRPGVKILDGLKKTASNVGYSTDQDLFKIIASLITVVLSLIGVVFLGMMLWAGFNWMTAAGEKEKITKARDTILSSAIGIIIIISAYAITKFIFTSLGIK